MLRFCLSYGRVGCELCVRNCHYCSYVHIPQCTALLSKLSFCLLFFSAIYFSRYILISKLKLFFFFFFKFKAECVPENIFSLSLFEKFYVWNFEKFYRVWMASELKVMWKCYKTISSFLSWLLHVFPCERCKFWNRYFFQTWD